MELAADCSVGPSGASSLISAMPAVRGMPLLAGASVSSVARGLGTVSPASTLAMLTLQRWSLTALRE